MVFSPATPSMALLDRIEAADILDAEVYVLHALVRDVYQQHAVDLIRDQVFEQLAARGRVANLRRLLAGLDLGDEPAAISFDDQIRAQIDVHVLAVARNPPGEGRLALANHVAGGAQQLLGFVLAIDGNARPAAGAPARREPAPALAKDEKQKGGPKQGRQ